MKHTDHRGYRLLCPAVVRLDAMLEATSGAFCNRTFDCVKVLNNAPDLSECCFESKTLSNEMVVPVKHSH